MITLSDITIFIVGISFIAILIILAKINRQLDKLESAITYTRTRVQEIGDSAKWNFDFIKGSLQLLAKRTQSLEEKKVTWIEKGDEVKDK